MKIVMVSLLCVFALFFLPVAVHAQDDSKNLGEVETNWPGIHYQIIIFKRIPPERLLAVIRVLATPQASPAGTTLGFVVPIPPEEAKFNNTFQYRDRPLSLRPSVMTEEKTKQQFPALSPVAPPGKAYRSGSTLATLYPHQNVVLTVQFAVPPPPPPDPSTGAPAKQTVSFLLPNAKGSIMHVPIPPLGTASEPTN